MDTIADLTGSKVCISPFPGTTLEVWKEMRGKREVLVIAARPAGAQPEEAGWSEIYDGLEFDPAGLRLRVDGEVVELTSNRARLLSKLLEHRGQVVTRDQAKAYLNVTGSCLEAWVHSLRRSMGRYGVNLQTVRGTGYRLY